LLSVLTQNRIPPEGLSEELAAMGADDLAGSVALFLAHRTHDQAVREALRAALDLKLMREQIEAQKRLERAATCLGLVAIGMAVVQVLVALWQTGSRCPVLGG
jgi:hypothetical protein